MRKKIILCAYVVAAFVVTCLAIFTGPHFSTGLVLEEGSVSEHRIRATADVVDEAATEENRRRARMLAENLQPSTVINANEWMIVENNLGEMRRLLAEARDAYEHELEAFEYAHVHWQMEHELYLTRVALRNHQIEQGIRGEPDNEDDQLDEPEEPVFLGESFSLFAAIPFHFTESEQEKLMEMDEESFAEFWEAVEYVAFAFQTEREINANDPLVTWMVRGAVQEELNDRALSDLAEIVVLRHLRPNVVEDEADNERRFQEELDRYERVIIPEGTIIIDEGDIVTAEALAILSDLGLLAPESFFDNRVSMLGVLVIVLALFLLCVLFIYHYMPKLTASARDCGLLFTLYLLAVVIAWFMGGMPYFTLPLLVFPFLASVLLGRRMAMVLTLSLVFVTYFIVDSDFVYIMFFAISGLMACIFTRYTTVRSKIILVGVYLAAVMFALSFALTLAMRGAYVFDSMRENLLMSAMAGANGLLTVILSMGSLPFWETLFGVVTPIKLLDLTNPTNPLLRRLTIEAPGTYHHSLIVANLAESAAMDIGANAHAARVGGYYHDVGKLKYPHNFVENIDGENPHDHMDPHKSASIIMGHVAYGLTLAEEHRLPQFVRDIIKEHHGTTLMQFFYTKAKNNGIDASEQDFRYPHVVPQSKESAVVMLADSVEAAARSMMPKLKSLGELSKIIENIVRHKLNDGQLADSDLSIKDVAVIEKSFYRVLKGMYHERIAYPAPAKPAEPSPAGAPA